MVKERTDFKGRTPSEMSKIIGMEWMDAPPDVKLHFKTLAEAKKVEHQARYPHYGFNPVKKSVKVNREDAAKLVDVADQVCHGFRDTLTRLTMAWCLGHRICRSEEDSRYYVVTRTRLYP
jgi:hypothetical protein